MKRAIRAVTVLILVIAVVPMFVIAYSGERTFCAPPNPGPLDELAIIREEKRGWPFNYSTVIPADYEYCMQERSFDFKPLGLAADIATWLALLFMVVLINKKLLTRSKS